MTRVVFKEQVGINLATSKKQPTGVITIHLEGEFVGHKHVKSSVIHFRHGLTDAQQQEILEAAEKFYDLAATTGKEPPTLPAEDNILRTEDYDD